MGSFIWCLLCVSTALAQCWPVLRVATGTTCGTGQLNVNGALVVDNHTTLQNVIGTDFTQADGTGTLSDALGGVPKSSRCGACADLYVPDCHVPACLPAGGYSSANPNDAWVCTTTPAIAYPNGTTLGCGTSGLGQCAQMSPAPQPHLSIGCATAVNFSAIAMTTRVTCGIMAPEAGAGRAGRVACWGDIRQKGGKGPVTYKSASPVQTWTPSGGSVVYPFVQIAAASSMFYAVDSAGELYDWGYTRAGNSMSPTLQGSASNLLLQPTWEDVHNNTLPTFLASGETITQLAQTDGNAQHMCFSSSLGKVYCWGKNSNGQCGRNDTSSTAPLSWAIEAPANPKAMACSLTHTLVSTTSGPPYVKCGGQNSNGECSADGTPSGNAVTWVTPALPAVGISGVVDVALISGASGVVVEINSGAADNRVYVWGYYSDYATHGLPAGLGLTYLPATQVSMPSGAPQPIHYAMMNSAVAGVVVADGRLAMTCSGVYGTCGIERGTDIFQFYTPTFRPVQDVIGWSNNVCALQDDGVVLCWGDNEDGQAGAQPVLTSPPKRLGYSYDMGL